MPVKKQTKKAATTKSASRTKVEKITSRDMLPKIKVFGVGGSGKNATNYMIKHDVKGVKFVAINTDSQDLDQSKASKKIHIGKTITSGSGTGMNPEVGKESAMENKNEIAKALEDTSIVFITGGMGGGTGSGASPVIAQVAKDMGILTVAVVTKPFSFEGSKRMTVATEAIEELGQYVDAYIVIPNDKILEVADEDATMNDAFALSDDVLLQAVTGISNLITIPGRINIDASDVRTVLENQGLSLVGIGKATGENRATESAEKAINSPLLDISVRGAKSVLFSITAGDDLKMSEVAKVAETITKEIDPEAVVKFGTIRDLKLKKGEIRVTVVASGFTGHPGQIIKKEIELPAAQETVEGSDDIFKEMEKTALKVTKQNKSNLLSLKEETADASAFEEKEPVVHKEIKKAKREDEVTGEKSNEENEDFWSLPSFLKK